MAGRNPETTSKKPADQVSELRDLVVGYAKQETVDPLRSLKRYLAMGVGGAAAIGVGSVFLLLGLLRALQRVDWFNGPRQRDGLHGSWLIYLITFLAGIALLGLVGVGALRSSSKRRKGADR
jgi:hypothetical protein